MKNINNVLGTAPPGTVDLVYKVFEGTHVFTARQMRGLYVAHSDLKAAYDQILPTIQKLIEMEFGVVTSYRVDTTLEEFCAQLSQSGDDGSLESIFPIVHARLQDNQKAA